MAAAQPQQVVVVQQQQVAGAAVPLSQKPLDCCIYATLFFSALTFVGGIVYLAVGAGLTYYNSIAICGFLVLLGGACGIPAVFCKNKYGMIAFIVSVVILCIIGGAVTGLTFVVGATEDALCKAFEKSDATYFVCPVKGSNCKGSPAYSASDTNAPNCAGQNGDDLTCCQGVATHYAKSSNNQGCVSAEQKQRCDEAKTAANAAVGLIAFSIIGCISGCVGCCTCCMNGGFFDNHEAQANVTVAAVAAPQTEVVAANVAAPPEMGKTEAVAATVADPQTELAEVPPTMDGPTPPPEYGTLGEPGVAPPPAAQRSCCGAVI